MIDNFDGETRARLEALRDRYHPDPLPTRQLCTLLLPIPGKYPLHLFNLLCRTLFRVAVQKHRNDILLARCSGDVIVISTCWYVDQAWLDSIDHDSERDAQRRMIAMVARAAWHYRDEWPDNRAYYGDCTTCLAGTREVRCEIVVSVEAEMAHTREEIAWTAS